MYAKKFNQDIGAWNTSNVTDMRAMFRNAIYFNSDLSKWDVSNVEHMCEMFQNAIFFKSDLSKWDISKVLDARSMFDNCPIPDQNNPLFYTEKWKTYLIEAKEILEDIFFKSNQFKLMAASLAKNLQNRDIEDKGEDYDVDHP